MRQGLWNDAELWRTQALEVVENHIHWMNIDSYQANKGVLLVSRALIYHRLGRGNQALQDLEVAIPLLERAKRRDKNLIHAFNTRGMLYRHRGETNKARADYRRAMKLARKIRDLVSLGITLNRYGALYNDIGKYSSGLRYSQYAVLILGGTDNQEVMGSALNNMGVSFVRLDRLVEGINCYNLSFQIRKRIGEKRGQHTVLSNLGKAYMDHSNRTCSLMRIDLMSPKRYRLGLALGHLEKAYSIAASIEDTRGQCNLLNQIGGAYIEMSKVEDALGVFRAGLHLNQEVGDKNFERNIRRNIAQFSPNLFEAVEQMRVVVQIGELMQHIELQSDKEMLSYYEYLFTSTNEN